MNATLSREDVLELIKEDLTNQRLVYGVNAMGYDGDSYSLDLYKFIFKALGIKDDYEDIDEIFYKYNELSKKVKDINVIESRENLNPIVLEIYDYLLSRIRN